MSDAILAPTDSIGQAPSGKPKLDRGMHPGGIIAFLLVLVAGLGYAVVSLVADMNAVHQEPLAIGAFVLLGLALLIALGTAIFAAVSPPAVADTVCVALFLAAAALALLYGAKKALGRLFFWHILSIRIFFWQHATGRRPDYVDRIAVFRDRVLAEMAHWRANPADAPDEVLIVGHSLGAAMAVEVAAQVLARLGTDDRAHPRLSLVTLGSGLPFVALQHEAHTLRRDIATLVFSDRIVWCDYQAPQDWLNCYGFNPIFDLGFGRPAFLACNPLIRSAGVKDRIPEDDYKRLRLKPFHMHFQFLKANFRPGEYDFFEMILGRQSLLDRALRPICRRAAEPKTGA